MVPSSIWPTVSSVRVGSCLFYNRTFTVQTGAGRKQALGVFDVEQMSELRTLSQPPNPGPEGRLPRAPGRETCHGGAAEGLGGHQQPGRDSEQGEGSQTPLEH